MERRALEVVWHTPEVGWVPRAFWQEHRSVCKNALTLVGTKTASPQRSLSRGWSEVTEVCKQGS